MTLNTLILLIILVLILLAVLHHIFFPTERKGYVVKVHGKEFFFDTRYEAEEMVLVYEYKF